MSNISAENWWITASFISGADFGGATTLLKRIKIKVLHCFPWNGTAHNYDKEYRSPYFLNSENKKQMLQYNKKIQIKYCFQNVIMNINAEMMKNVSSESPDFVGNWGSV